MKEVKGNLIELAKNGEFDVIVHGCNCFCKMGAGLAKQIRANFPEAYKVDQQTKRGDYDKLGTCSVADCGCVVVVNAYTQFGYASYGRSVDYDAIRSCMKWIVKTYLDKKIGLPKIGAGLGGGDWNIIKKILEEEMGGMDVTVVEWSNLKRGKRI